MSPRYVLRALDHAEAREIYVELSAAHRACFPDEAPESVDEDTADGFFDRVTWLHDERTATWFILRDLERDGRVVGFACGHAYADSWYGAHLGVVPDARGRGLGSYLMRASQAHASALGMKRLQASVEIDPKIGRGRLLRYYERHGARVVETGIGSAGSVPASVVRIERYFTKEIAARELAKSERIVMGGGRGKFRRLRATAIVAFALAAMRKKFRFTS